MLGVLYYCRLVVLQHSYWSNVSNRSVDIYFSAHMTRFWNNFTSKNYQTNKFKISERKKHKKSKQDSPTQLGLHMPEGNESYLIRCISFAQISLTIERKKIFHLRCKTPFICADFFTWDLPVAILQLRRLPVIF